MGNVSPLPKWVMKVYAELWVKFDEKTFLFSEAVMELKIPKERMSVIISELNKSGWIAVELDKNDSRKRRYKLKKPDEVIIGMSTKIN
jgi:hypothetical protein